MKEINFGKTESHFKDIGIFFRQKTTFKTLLYINDHLTWKNRLQWSSARQQDQDTKGLLISSGIDYHEERLKIIGLISLFDTDDFENRQYIYLNSLPYSHRQGVFQNKGSNVDLVVNFRASEHLLLSANFIQTIYRNLNETGDGHDKITGNKKSEAGIQLILTL